MSLLTMDAPRLEFERSVRIEDGRIVAIESATDIDTNGCTIIDGRGLVLMPGLADMHTHVYDFGIVALFLAAGVTSVRNMSGMEQHLAYRRVIDQGRFPGPHLVTTSPIFDGVDAAGRPSHSAVSVPIRAPEDAGALVADVAARGYQQLKVYSLLSLETHRAVCDAAAEHGLPVVGHCPEALTFEQAIANGQTCFEHLGNIEFGHLSPAAAAAWQVMAPGGAERVNQFTDLILKGLDRPALRGLAAELAGRQVWNCPTMVVYRKLFTDAGAGSEAGKQERDQTWLDCMPVDIRRRWQHFLDPQGVPPEVGGEVRAWLDSVRRLHDTRLEMLALLHDEGAPLLVGTDTTNPFIVPGFGLHDELEQFVSAGMSPYDALRCATVEPARFLGDAEAGTIRVGQRADLLLLRSNPLQSVGAVRDIEAVFVNGWTLRRADLDAMVEHRRTRASSQLARPTLGGRQAQRPAQRVLREDELFEHVLGEATGGRLRFRWQQHPDGTLTISEAYHGQTRLQHRWTHLTSTGDLLAARVHNDPGLGQDLLNVEWQAEPVGYQVRWTSLTGERRASFVPGQMAGVSPRFGLTAAAALPRAASGHETREVLTVEGRDGNQVLRARCELQPDGDGWTVTVHQPMSATAVGFSTGPDGDLSRIHLASEFTEFLGTVSTGVGSDSRPEGRGERTEIPA